jgi:type I restriction enzyme M protein
VRNIVVGNTLSDDGHANTKFDYMLSNPPFGVEWKKVEKDVRKEHDKGFDGRFGPGLPRVSDGSMLFLLHLISKMRPAAEGGSRIGIVLNGSPLFTGGAGSGESEIRRYVLENDLVEPSSACPPTCSTTPASAPTSGFCPTRSPTSARAGCSSSTPAASGRRCARAQGDVGRDLTRLFGDFVEAEQAIVLDAAGKELARQILLFGDTPPVAPAGKVKIVPISASSRTRSSATPRSPSSARCATSRQHRARRARQAEGQAPARQQPARHRERAAA